MTGGRFYRSAGLFQTGIKGQWGSRPRARDVRIGKKSLVSIEKRRTHDERFQRSETRNSKNFHRTDVITKQEDDARAALAARALCEGAQPAAPRSPANPTHM